jgi:hypothetical protein
VTAKVAAAVAARVRQGANLFRALLRPRPREVDRVWQYGSPPLRQQELLAIMHTKLE